MHSALVSLLRAAAAFALALVGACLAPVRVEPISDAEFHDSLDVCALHGDVPSARTAWLLRLAESEQAFRDDPVATVQALHARVEAEDSAEALFALSELSYLAGKRRHSRECYLAAAVYAHLYLLHDPPPSAYDRRFRWACDIYNRSLVRALKDPEDGRISLEPGVRDAPGGLAAARCRPLRTSRSRRAASSSSPPTSCASSDSASASAIRASARR